MKHHFFCLSLMYLVSFLGTCLCYADSYFDNYYSSIPSHMSDYGSFGGANFYGGGGYSMNNNRFPMTSMNSDIQEQINSAFRIAVREDRVRDIQKLLEMKKVDINSPSVEGITSLMYAARNCSSDIVKMLLNLGANVNSQDSKGRTALMYAVRENCKSVSVLLCQSPNLNLKLKDEQGRTAQDYASAETLSDVAGSATEISQFLVKTAIIQKNHLKKRNHS